MAPEYTEVVRILLARFLAVIGMLSAMQWAVLPVAAATCSMSGHAANSAIDCPACCETAMLTGGGLACGGCQLGVEAAGAAMRLPLGVMIAWRVSAAPASTGIDLSPADPPPR